MAIDQQVFDKLATAYKGQLPDFPWYCYGVVVFQVHDKMEHIGQTWRYVLENTRDEDDQLRVARQIREALLKASVLVGFPKGINALTTLRQYIKDSAPSLQEKLDKDYSLRQPLQRDEKDARGKDFFSKIYGQHTEKVLHNLCVASGGDLAEFAINAVYGDLMAETSRLDAMQTSLLEFVACYATGGTTTLQAKSHMYGSHNLGNTRAEIRAATTICDAIEAELRAEIDRTGAEWSWLAKADGWWTRHDMPFVSVPLLFAQTTTTDECLHKRA